MCRRVRMSPTEFSNLRQIMPEITAELSKLKPGHVSDENIAYRKHIGSGIYVTILQRRSGIDLRHFHPLNWKHLAPTPRGLYVKKQELTHLQAAIEKLADEYRKFGQAVGNICSSHNYHYETRLKNKCAYCNPFGLNKTMSKEKEQYVEIYTCR